MFKNRTEEHPQNNQVLDENGEMQWFSILIINILHIFTHKISVLNVLVGWKR